MANAAEIPPENLLPIINDMGRKTESSLAALKAVVARTDMNSLSALKDLTKVADDQRKMAVKEDANNREINNDLDVIKDDQKKFDNELSTLKLQLDSKTDTLEKEINKQFDQNELFIKNSNDSVKKAMEEVSKKIDKIETGDGFLSGLFKGLGNVSTSAAARTAGRVAGSGLVGAITAGISTAVKSSIITAVGEVTKYVGDGLTGLGFEKTGATADVAGDALVGAGIGRLFGPMGALAGGVAGAGYGMLRNSQPLFGGDLTDGIKALQTDAQTEQQKKAAEKQQEQETSLISLLRQVIEGGVLKQAPDANPTGTGGATGGNIPPGNNGGNVNNSPTNPSTFTGSGEGYGNISKQEIVTYIREAATKRGIDPEVAIRVYRSEGESKYVGDSKSSFGPFQLHYGGVAGGGNAVGGIGDTFTQRTGLDARNPATWKQQVDFSLDEAKRGGWGPWHGWKGDKWAGLRGGASATTPVASSPTTPAPGPEAGSSGGSSGSSYGANVLSALSGGSPVTTAGASSGIDPKTVSPPVGAPQTGQNGMPTRAQVPGGGQAGGLVTLRTQSGKAYQVASEYASNFKGFVDELEGKGYKIYDIGGFRKGSIIDGTNKLSWHAKGMAIDINPKDNPVTWRGQADAGKTNLPSDVGQIAAKHGLGWGGNWKNKLDTMHFSMGPNEGGSGRSNGSVGSENDVASGNTQGVGGGGSQGGGAQAAAPSAGTQLLNALASSGFSYGKPGPSETSGMMPNPVASMLGATPSGISESPAAPAPPPPAELITPKPQTADITPQQPEELSYGKGGDQVVVVNNQTSGKQKKPVTEPSNQVPLGARPDWLGEWANKMMGSAYSGVGKSFSMGANLGKM